MSQENEIQDAIVVTESEHQIAKAKNELNEVIKIDFFQEIKTKIEAKISDAQNTVVTKDDSKLYKGAKSQMSEMKAIKKTIADFKKNTKSKIRELGRHIDENCEIHLKDITDAIQTLQIKMSVYEQEQERIKQEKKAKELEEQRQRQVLDGKLAEMANKFNLIEKCETEDAVREITDWLEQIDYESFGERKSEAVFQRSQIDMMCKMQIKVIKAQELTKSQHQPQEQPKVCPAPVFAPSKPKNDIELKIDEVVKDDENKELEHDDSRENIDVLIDDGIIEELESEKSETEVSDIKNITGEVEIEEEIKQGAISDLDIELSETNITVPIPKDEPREEEPKIYIDDETVGVLKSVTVYSELKTLKNRVVGFAGISVNDSLFSDSIELFLITYDNKGEEKTKKFVLSHE
jgi:hypothetical protein